MSKILSCSDSILSVKDGQKIYTGDVMENYLKLRQDITGGLPRVAELFEAEKLKTVQLLQKMMVKLFLVKK